MDEKLEDCPFCGKQPEKYWSGKNLVIHCLNPTCGVQPSVFGYQSSKEEYYVDPIAWWNKRKTNKLDK